MAGLFFCLASDTVQGFYFALLQYNPIQTFTVAFVPSMQLPPQQQNRLQDFTGVFPSICPISAHTIQQPHKPPIYRLHHVGGHTVKRSTSTDAQIPPPRRTLYRSTQPPYYNKVYKGATVRHIANHASPAGQPSSRGAAGGAEPLAATAVSLFGLSPDSQ